MLHFIVRLMETTSDTITAAAGVFAVGFPRRPLLDFLSGQLAEREFEVVGERAEDTPARTPPPVASTTPAGCGLTKADPFEVAWFALGEQLASDDEDQQREDTAIDVQERQDRLERCAAELPEETYRKYAL